MKKKEKKTRNILSTKLSELNEKKKRWENNKVPKINLICKIGIQ